MHPRDFPAQAGIIDCVARGEIIRAVDDEIDPCEQRIAARYGIKAQNRPADKWLQDTVRWTWKIKVFTHLELELMNELRERSVLAPFRLLAASATR